MNTTLAVKDQAGKFDLEDSALANNSCQEIENKKAFEL